MVRATASFEDSAFLLRTVPCAGGAVTLWYGREHGKHAGFMKRPPMPGTLADIHTEPMRNGGTLSRISADTEKAYGAVVGACGSFTHIKALQAALQLTDISQADGDPCSLLYDALRAFCDGLTASQENIAEAAIYAYPVFEALVLEASGYALSTQYCVKFPDEPAIYVSPKTGAGVGKEAGEPYKHKLLHLPPSFRSALLQWHTSPTGIMPACDGKEACLASAALTGHFISREFESMRYDARDAFITALTRHRSFAL